MSSPLGRSRPAFGNMTNPHRLRTGLLLLVSISLTVIINIFVSLGDAPWPILIGVVVMVYVALIIRNPMNALYFMIISAPLYLYRFAIPGLPVHVTIHRVCLAIAVAVSLVIGGSRWTLPGGQPDNTKLSKTYMLLAVVTIGWLLLDFVAAFRSQFDEGVNRLFPQLVGLLSLVLIVAVIRSKESLFGALWAYVFSAVLPIGVGLWQFITWEITGRFPGVPFQSLLETNLPGFDQFYKGDMLYGVGSLAVPRFASVLVDPNYLGAFLLTICLIVLAFAIESHQRRFLAVVLLIVAALILTLANSRSSFVGLICGLVVLMILVLTRQSSSRRVLFLGILIVLTISGIFLIASEFGLQEIFTARLSQERISGSARGRLDFLDAGWQAFLTNPIIGVGAYNILLTSDYYTAHSMPMTILAEYGILGFTFVFGFMAWVFVRLWRNRNEPDHLSIYIMPAFVGLLAASSFYTYLFTLEFIWVLWGIATVAAIRPWQETHAPLRAFALPSVESAEAVVGPHPPVLRSAGDSPPEGNY